MQDPAATVALRISGQSVIGTGLFPGDVAVVDRSLTPSNVYIVLALIDDESTIKRYSIVDGGIVLLSETSHFMSIAISAGRARDARPGQARDPLALDVLVEMELVDC